MAEQLIEIAHFAETIADQARTVSTRYFRQRLEVEHKNADQPVTIADRETEALMRRMIEEKFPAHGIYGEEYGETKKGAEYTWVIDPIDGTKSFITGMPLFGTLIALLHKGKPVIGIIDMPAINERWVGIEGKPTRFNGKPVNTRDCKKLSEAILYTTSPDIFKAAEEKTAWNKISAAVHLRRFGGDCYIYALLALGFADIAFETELQPYDYMALVPVITGAGGIITDWQGKTLTLESKGQVIATGTPELHAAALKLLAE